MIRAAEVKDEIERMGPFGFLKRLSPHATREGEKARASCPICNSENPRAMSASRKNDGTIVANCFVCGGNGDSLAITMQAMGMSFREALEFWATETGLTDTPQPQPQPIRHSPPVVRDAKLYAPIAERLLQFCPIAKQADVKTYMQSRGLYSEAVRDGWGALPVAGNGDGTQQTIYYQLQREFGRNDLEEGRNILKASGVTKLFKCNETGEWNHFSNNRHRLLIPWRGLDRNIVALQRRYIGTPPNGTEKLYFDKGTHPTTTLFGLHELAPCLDERDIAIELVEGAMDVLARRILLRREGQNRVVLGLMSATASLRDEWISWLRGRDVYVATDNDEAGQRCLARMTSELSRMGAVVHPLRPPTEFKDWAECLENKV